MKTKLFFSTLAMFHNRKSLFSTALKKQDTILYYTLWTSVSGGGMDIDVQYNNKYE